MRMRLALKPTNEHSPGMWGIGCELLRISNQPKYDTHLFTPQEVSSVTPLQSPSTKPSVSSHSIVEQDANRKKIPH